MLHTNITNAMLKLFVHHTRVTCTVLLCFFRQMWITSVFYINLEF